MNSITQGLLCKGHSVKVLSVESDKHKVNHHLITNEYATATNFESVYINLKINVFSAFAAWLSGESYHVKRFQSAAFAQKLTEILQKDTFDIVHIESIFLTPYLPVIRQHSNAKVILRAHNVEHLIWQRLAGCTSNALKRNYLKSLSLTLKNYELEHINDYDGIVCITAKDMDLYDWIEDYLLYYPEATDAEVVSEFSDCTRLSADDIAGIAQEIRDTYDIGNPEEGQI